MQRAGASIIHINVTDFAAAVEVAKNPSLADTPFVVALEGSARTVVLTPSHRAWEEGIRAGMPLRFAKQMVPSLQVLPWDNQSTTKADTAITSIAQEYSPSIQCDRGGHIYLDMQGTTRLFGPVVDSAVHIQGEIRKKLNLEASVAVASNKLVAKVGTRTTRPAGLIQVREGDEASFLAWQDVSLLSGVGSATARLLSVAGITTIGQIAALGDEQVMAFLGKRGLALRDAARGLDNSPLQSGLPEKRIVQRKISFAEPILEMDALKAAVVTAGEDAALSMRTAGLGAAKIHIALLYSDGRRSEASHRIKGQWVYDLEISLVAWKVAQLAASRRVRILSCTLSLGELSPLAPTLDLFLPDAQHRSDSLQQAVDRMRHKFGPGILTHGAALAHA
ncbi:DNA polymerase [uncultured Sphaerochaeta sp.]|uniref:DNA polymerase Y family protein n=1 Tax=uncultured Sphaerochaeta sp. TaxID=886478 RepID=UPI002A0A202D|nr:DNA polymerase [uncultured Sphaerochaeta sp.]